MMLGYFLSALAVSTLVTWGVKKIMQNAHIIDLVNTTSRKIHTKPIPLGGGVAIYLTFFSIAGIAWALGKDSYATFELKTILGLFLGSTILIIGGLIDDKYTLRPRYQIVFPILAAIVAVFCGIGPTVISNPLGGGAIDLSYIQWSIEGIGQIVLFADIVAFFWLFGIMFTTKFLDGLDGLVTGIVAIGALMIYLVSMQPQWYEPNIALLSIIFAGTCIGFLLWNFNPAKIFLGEGGSLVTGFILGCLAIISRSKVAITMMVVGLPMIDVLRVIIARIRKGKPIYRGDREHLHFRLIESGLSQRQAVLLLYTISFLFGMSALFVQTKHGLIALSFLFLLMLLLGLWLSKRGGTSQ